MIFEYFIIGLIQGITEFLPVSSSGHIVLFSEIFNLDTDVVLLSVVVHIATLFSVIICNWTKIKHIARNPFDKDGKNLIIATIPAVLVVLIFNKLIDKMFGLKWVIIGFLITGIMLIIADLIKPKYEVCNKRTALYMGLMQGLAILPGISRSGSTMAVGMMSGLKKEEACEFTFLMSIPIILGSAIWESVGLIGSNLTINFLPLLVAFITAFIFGILSIKLMLKVLKSNKLYYFSIYLLILSIVSIIVCYF